MAMVIRCPVHGGSLRLPEAAAGTRVRCPLCEAVFEAPAASAPASPSAQAIRQTPAARAQHPDLPPRTPRRSPRERPKQEGLTPSRPPGAGHSWPAPVVGMAIVAAVVCLACVGAGVLYRMVRDRAADPEPGALLAPPADPHDPRGGNEKGGGLGKDVNLLVN